MCWNFSNCRDYSNVILLLISSSVPWKCKMGKILVFNFYPSIINSSPASRLRIKIIYFNSATKNLLKRRRTLFNVHSMNSRHIILTSSQKNLYGNRCRSNDSPKINWKYYENSPSHTWLIILIRFITLKNNWMNSCVKTEGKCNESVNNEFKIMKESNSLPQIMRVSK